MTFRSVIDLLELLDDGRTAGAQVAEYLSALGSAKVSVKRVEGDKPGTFTDFIRCEIAGTRGKISGGSAPTLGIIGRLGGVGARPARKGFVSDGDGALAALAAAAKLIKMQPRGDRLEGDVIVTTQVCENAPTRPHEPVPFMSSCVDQYVKNRYEVDPAMDAILSVDTTKGNRIINKRGFALSPTIKDGLHPAHERGSALTDERNHRETPGGVPAHAAGHHAVRQRALSHEFHCAARFCRQSSRRRRGHHDRILRPGLRDRRNSC